MQLNAYINAEWKGKSDTHGSRTGKFIFLGNSVIISKCKKHNSVSKSSTIVEYRSMSSTSSKIIWLRHLLKELNVFISTPTPLYVHNKSVIIKLTRNPQFHEWTKYINGDYHLIRE